MERNTEDMDLMEQIIATREVVCKEYCRYTELKKKGQINADEYNEVCSGCPLSRL